MPLSMDVGLSSGDFVLDGDPVLPPHFRPISIVPNPTAGCIKMPLGMDIGLSPGEFVLDGDPAPLHKMGAEPLPRF